MKKVEALKIILSEETKKNMINNVRQVLDDNIRWTNSEFVEKLEKVICEYTGAKYASVVSSGSTAIETVLYALGVEEDSVAFVPTLTAPPTVYSCLHAGMKVVLVDASVTDLGMDLKDLQSKICKYANYKNRVIVPVHIGGIISKNIDEIVNIAKTNNIFVIEDCAHAHGSKLKGLHAGVRGNAGTFSFFLTKVITCGEGGAIITNDKEIDKKCKIIRNYGKVNDLHVYNGSSWRMNEFTAAIALEQMKNADKIVNGRRAVAKMYDKLLCDSQYYSSPRFSDDIELSYYKYILFLKEQFDPRIVEKRMKEEYGVILAGAVYRNACHLEPVFKNNLNILNIDDDFCNSEAIAKTHICLPIYDGMSMSDVKYVANSLKKLLNEMVKERTHNE